MPTMPFTSLGEKSMLAGLLSENGISKQKRTKGHHY
jgi:hypothetical protein